MYHNLLDTPPPPFTTTLHLILTMSRSMQSNGAGPRRPGDKEGESALSAYTSLHTLGFPVDPNEQTSAPSANPPATSTPKCDSS